MKSPFDTLSELQKNKIFDLVGAHVFTYRKGEEILSTIKTEDIICIILNGSVNILNIDYNGNESVQESLEQYGIFGTRISLTNTESCQIIAKKDTEIAVIDYENLFLPHNLQHHFFNVFMRNMFDIVNIKMKGNNERMQILRKKQIRERLLEFFETEHKRNRQASSIYLQFSLKELADYISVDRSAMFRELKNLKDEKIISITGRKITLLYK